MSRQNGQSQHEKKWRMVHPAIKAFFTSAVASYKDTSSRQNFIGAEAAAFQTLMLPVELVKGPGEVVWKQTINTAPQVYVTQSVVPTGIAGIASGQIWNGGLIDNPNVSDNLSGEIV